MLTPRQRQVLAYLRTFVDDEGYLPTTREIAAACGLRSPSTARLVLNELVEIGLVERDPDHPRRAVIAGGGLPARVPARDELLLCELTMVEIEASITVAQRMLAVAPDDEALEALHRRCLERLGLLRSYRTARTRIEATGARLSAPARASVEIHRQAVERRTASVTTWDEYRVHVVLLDSLVARFLERAEAFGASHLSVAYATERVVRPDRRLRLDDVDGTLADFAIAHLEQLTDDCAQLLASLSDSLSATLLPASSAVLEAADTRRSHHARSRGASSVGEPVPPALVAPPSSRAI